ncbi:hypothetical protein V6N12_058244 [Hibiscus sabdariffa]|uniref:RNase H type-1 domain-containing protein n=1 Tax=Hibiscus sabdariffa TaxID=183260 RepID=A0ABR2EVM6_9ROSI
MIVSEAMVAWPMVFPRIQVQSNNSVALRMIIDPIGASSYSSLIRSISLLQNRPWELSFLWIPWEQNMVTDCLPKLSPPLDVQLSIYDDVPELIQSLLI